MKKNGNLKRSIHLLNVKAEQALRQAVAETIRDHARTGDPVAIWRNGKVVWLSAKRVLRQLAERPKVRGRVLKAPGARRRVKNTSFFPLNPVSWVVSPRQGFTLIELLIGAATLAIAIVALLGAFFGQITLNEHARNMTWAINDANRVMERLRQVNSAGGAGCPTPSIAVPAECGDGDDPCPAAAAPTNGWDTWLADNGDKSIRPDQANNELVVVTPTGGPDPLTITVAICWRHRGRILGECVDNGPGLQVNDADADGIIESPAMLTTLMTCRN